MSTTEGPRLDLGRLPIAGPLLIGRETELAHLDAAWDDPGTHVLTFVAFGGVGKSALVSHWMDGMAKAGWRGARRVLEWSFYSQGTEDRVTSADRFLDHALGWFGDPDPKAGVSRDRGLRLAELVRREKTLLVLDGVEPLQHPPTSVLAGQLKDPGLSALLKSLAGDNPGLCVVTTRERITDLDRFPRTAPQRGDRDGMEQHVTRARELVEETGYERRRREVVYLEKRLAELPPPPKEEPMKDFFVSFNKADRAWAEWIAWTLEEAGYQVVYQGWDFLPGQDFILKMQEAASNTRRTVMVLSDSYLQSGFTQPEWTAAFAQDPRGDQRKLIAFRVAPCSPPGILAARIYADLVGLSPDEAKAAVLQAVSDGPRAKPAVAPAFPGTAAAPASTPAPFPGPPPAAAAKPGSGALAVWREKLEFLLEQEPLAEGATQKFALRKQIEEAREKIRELGG